MSRIGNKPIPIPSGVEVKISPGFITVKGPKGELKKEVHEKMDVQKDQSEIKVSRNGNDGFSKALHGLTRNNILNMVTGVTRGFEKVLEITGVGYRAQVQGKNLSLTLGFSHPVQVELPKGIEASVEKQTIVTLKGTDKILLGQVASNIRGLKEPEPYKGKGIKYAGEKVLRKEGKTGK
ncbi:MAG: 50S ribosomal protein L6 [Nitrospiria bacterium]